MLNCTHCIEHTMTYTLSHIHCFMIFGNPYYVIRGATINMDENF